MPSPKMRHAVRAIVVDELDRVLLGRHQTTQPSVVVWAAPGGGIEPGETLQGALARELREEVGLTLVAEPAPLWHQEVVGPAFVAGYDGIVNDYFLVPATTFTPRGQLTDAQLADERISGWRWWTRTEIAGYRGPDVFSPRDLAALLTSLFIDGPPVEPLLLGL